MPTYYCPACADALKLKNGIDTSSLLGSIYQQEKFTKHTVSQPATSEPAKSRFDSSSTQYYGDCIQETVEKGFIEIDDQNRKNVLFCPSTGSSLGTKYKWGKLASRPDTVVAVKTSDPGGIHAMLEDSSNYSGRNCSKCGGPLR